MKLLVVLSSYFHLANISTSDLVDGIIWSDERPFCEGLLQNNASYVIVYSKQSSFYQLYLLFSGKPWFWETKRLAEDKKDGIVWGNMYPKAPPFDKTRRRMPQHKSEYMNIKEQTGIPRSTVIASDKI